MELLTSFVAAKPSSVKAFAVRAEARARIGAGPDAALRRFYYDTVTHDRDLIGSFATRLFAFTPAGLVDFKGTYEQFLAQSAELASPAAK